MWHGFQMLLWHSHASIRIHNLKIRNPQTLFHKLDLFNQVWFIKDVRKHIRNFLSQWIRVHQHECVLNWIDMWSKSTHHWRRVILSYLTGKQKASRWMMFKSFIHDHSRRWIMVKIYIPFTTIEIILDLYLIS